MAPLQPGLFYNNKFMPHVGSAFFFNKTTKLGMHFGPMREISAPPQSLRWVKDYSSLGSKEGGSKKTLLSFCQLHFKLLNFNDHRFLQIRRIIKFIEESPDDSMFFLSCTETTHFSVYIKGALKEYHPHYNNNNMIDYDGLGTYDLVPWNDKPELELMNYIFV